MSRRMPLRRAFSGGSKVARVPHLNPIVYSATSEKLTVSRCYDGTAKRWRCRFSWYCSWTCVPTAMPESFTPGEIFYYKTCAPHAVDILYAVIYVSAKQLFLFIIFIQLWSKYKRYNRTINFLGVLLYKLIKNLKVNIFWNAF
jgi:hypothetical protein